MCTGSRCACRISLGIPLTDGPLPPLDNPDNRSILSKAYSETIDQWYSLITGDRFKFAFEFKIQKQKEVFNQVLGGILICHALVFILICKHLLFGLMLCTSGILRGIVWLLFVCIVNYK